MFQILSNMNANAEDLARAFVNLEAQEARAIHELEDARSNLVRTQQERMGGREVNKELKSAKDVPG